MEAGAYGYVLFSVEGGVATITPNRPSADGKEAVQAIFEKRRPVFTGH